jgi:hypothetical protein
MNRFQGMNSASLYSLAGRYDKPISTRFLALIDCLKSPALAADAVHTFQRVCMFQLIFSKFETRSWNYSAAYFFYPMVLIVFFVIFRLGDYFNTFCVKLNFGEMKVNSIYFLSTALVHCFFLSLSSNTVSLTAPKGLKLSYNIDIFH